VDGLTPVEAVRQIRESKRREAEKQRIRHDAAERLKAWADLNAQRDRLIRYAIVAGVSRREIVRLTGVARTTIDRILDRTPGGMAVDARSRVES